MAKNPACPTCASLASLPSTSFITFYVLCPSHSFDSAWMSQAPKPEPLIDPTKVITEAEAAATAVIKKAAAKPKAGNFFDSLMTSSNKKVHSRQTDPSLQMSNQAHTDCRTAQLN